MQNWQYIDKGMKLNRLTNWPFMYVVASLNLAKTTMKVRKALSWQKAYDSAILWKANQQTDQVY